MATSGRKLDSGTIASIRRMREHGVSVRHTAKAAQVSTATVQKISRIPLAK